MTTKHERPRRPSAKAVEGDALSPDSTAAGPTPQEPEAAVCVPVRDKLRWTWDDIEAVTGYERRRMQQEISAGRMPRADLRAGRRAGRRPSTILGWLDAMADRRGRRSRP
jgi:hypothetical protein